MARRKGGDRPEPSVPSWEPEIEAILERGVAASLAYAIQPDRSCRARDYYEALSLIDQQKFDHLFLTVTEHGKILNPEKFRRDVGQTTCSLAGKTSRIAIAEFKIHGRRILAYQRGR